MAVAIVAIVAMFFALLAHQVGTSADRRPDAPRSAEVILYIDPPITLPLGLELPDRNPKR